MAVGCEFYAFFVELDHLENLLCGCEKELKKRNERSHPMRLKFWVLKETVFLKPNETEFSFSDFVSQFY